MRGNFTQEDGARRRSQRQRRNVVPALPKSLSEINIPEEWQRASTGDQFQLLDETLEEGSRIIVFCTDYRLKYLCSSLVQRWHFQYFINSILTWYRNGSTCSVDVLYIVQENQGYLSLTI